MFPHPIFYFSLAIDGYITLPNEMILFWEFYSVAKDSDSTKNFAKPFPNDCLAIVAQDAGTSHYSDYTNGIMIPKGDMTKSSFRIILRRTATTVFVFAIGY